MPVGSGWMRLACGGTLALLLFAAAVLTCSPGRADAKPVTVPAGFLGTMPPEFPSDEELTRMHQGGIDTYRIVLDMNNVERQQGVMNWAPYDGLLSDAARHGITVFPVLFSVPAWISRNPATLPLDT